jgi:hypothetical protein
MRPNCRSCYQQPLSTRQVKAILRIVVYLFDDLLCKSTPKQPVRLLWSFLAYAGRLWRATFVAIQLTQPEVGRQ